MRIRATSDLHGALPTIEPCDILLIGGDICPIWNHSLDFQMKWLRENFQQWIWSIPAKHVIWIAGNHDFVLDQSISYVEGSPRSQLDIQGLDLAMSIKGRPDQKVEYLEDRAITIDKISIYGTPWTPNLPGWGFQAEGQDAQQKFANMGDWNEVKNIDILLSHGPPAGYGDRVSMSHVGSPELLEAIKTIAPPIVICGHIHEGFGSYQMKECDTHIYCVSHMDRDYRSSNPVVEIEL